MQKIVANNSEDDDYKDSEFFGGGTMLEERVKTKKPSLYKVLLLNDDYTPMEFVIVILQTVFGKSLEQAENVMWMVHTKGVGVCGIYTYEVAESKAARVVDFARKNDHPLQCTVEKE